MVKFGTDGVRGIANTELTAEFSLRLGRAAARVLSRSAEFPNGAASNVVIGGDTRMSTPMIDAAVSAGFAAEGIDVIRLGVVPTPMVAFVAQRLGAMGVMVSASHNPFYDNGIKLFAPGGAKLSDEIEAAIEYELEALQPPTGAAGSIIIDDSRITAGRHDYTGHVLAITEGRRLDGLRVVVDAANGAASHLAGPVLKASGADVVVIAASPDGRNINDGCGATVPTHVAASVLELGADIGIALDGDADRLIAVDHTGAVVDGDHVIAIAALDLLERGRLANDTVVVTTMTNLGFHHAMRDAGIRVVTTDVGDRYVLEALAAGRHSLGGEQSGHVIFSDHATTGDGMLTAVALLDVVARRGRRLADLAAAAMTSLPQVLVNVEVGQRVPDVVEQMSDEIARVTAELADEGRVLVRASGTEPLVRIMVEAPTAEIAGRAADELAAVARHRFA